VTKPKRFLDSLREMVSPQIENICDVCHAPYTGELCPSCGNASNKAARNGDDASADKTGAKSAYLVDLVSNHKIQIPIPLCKVGRDESNDIVISGDQAISRQHLMITKEGDQFYAEDANSRHGSFINGTQLKSKEPINDGDVLKIGVSLFWFVAEAASEETENADLQTIGKSQSNSQKPTSASSEHQHVSVKSEFFLEPTDPSTSTATEIPVLTNEEVLLDRLRLKTRSFENSDSFVQAELQPGALRTNSAGNIREPMINRESASTTQPFLPALDSVSGEKRPSPTIVPVGAELMSSEEEIPSPKSPEVKIKENEPFQYSAPEPANPISSSESRQEPAPALVIPTPEAAAVQPAPKPVSFAQALTQPTPPAPRANQQSLNDFLTELGNEHERLRAKIEEAEKHRQDIAEKIASIKELSVSLIGGRENAVITACQKVLSQLGWQCEITEESNQDLLLRADNVSSIAHIMWTADKLERNHLGKLFIAQTRFWCDQGVEPKGVLIISLLGKNDASESSKFVLNQDAKMELTNFVKNKNVCLLTTANLLAIYHALTSHQFESRALREKIMCTDGWLEGFDLEPFSI